MTKDLGPVNTSSLDDDFELFKSSTFLFSVIANKQTHISSTELHKRFGIGVVENRCVVILTMEEGITAARICEVSGMHKGLVSKALAKLQKMNYVEPYAFSKVQKPMRLQLSSAGKALQQEMLAVVKGIEDDGLKCLSQKEKKQLLGMLMSIYRTVESL